MTFLIGVLSGFVNGLFGSGAGMVLLPSLISFVKFDSKVARGTSLFILVIVSFITSFFYVKNVPDYTALWFIISGGILGGVIGARFSKFISNEFLKFILGIIMIVSSIRIFLR